ncbi:MAG TPA: IclR family transcriptional regulator [Chloroflexota bacterium]|nr:IclR family transcriptional regulator [Chloroflexota bacterium]
MINSLGRGLRVLTMLAEANGPLGVTELAVRLNVDPSSSYRLLATLEQQGFVRQEPHGKKYALGYAVLGVAAAVLRKLDVAVAAAPHLRALAASTGESTHLAVLDGANAVFIGREIAAAVLRVDTTIGSSEPAHCTAVGKALVADLDRAELARRFGDGPFTSFTARTITTLEELTADLLRCRAQGHARDDEEMHIGVRCLAAPIQGHLGNTVAALGLSGPAGRLTHERLPELATAVAEAAGEVSLAMGFVQRQALRA